MAERVLRVGSAGKMFSLTGWKIGWVTGAAPLVDVVAKAHQFLTFTTSPALQLGVAHGFAHEMDFTLGLTRELQEKRDLLANGLKRMGFDVLPCEGTYFLTAGIRKFTNEPDTVFCERLTREAGVALIPLSAFFDGQHARSSGALCLLQEAPGDRRRACPSRTLFRQPQRLGLHPCPNLQRRS